jgi:hypothetical protein
VITTLTCIECKTPPVEQATGWVGYLVDLDEDGEDEVVFYCPRCAQREFSQRPDAADA